MMPAGLALQELAGAVVDHPVIGGITARAAKAAWPARSLERLLALRFGAEARHEFRQRHALLELNAVERHDPISSWGWESGYDSSGSPDEPHEARY